MQPDFATLQPAQAPQGQQSQGPDFASLKPASQTQSQGSGADSIWSNLASAGSGVMNALGAGNQNFGQALGNSVYGIASAGNELLKGNPGGAGQAIMDAGNANAKIAPKAIGDVISDVALPASLAIGGGAGSSVLARTGDAALKYGVTSAAMGGGQALSQGASAPDALKSAAVSGATGAALGGASQLAGEGLNAIVNNLPNRLAKQALPKLGQGNEEYALNNIKVGSIKSLLGDSQSSVSNLGQQVQTILKNSDYAGETGAGDFAINKTLNAFPNSEYTPESIIGTVKNLVPAQSKIVDGIADGSATIAEKNTLRSALDNVVKKAFTDSPDLTANKEIGLQFSNALRGEVQSFAPETQPVFAKLSKELDLQNALASKSKQLASKSALGLYDIVAAMGGFATGGPVGTGLALSAEKALRSPAVGLAAAKGLKAAAPALEAGGRALTNVAIPQIAKSVGRSTLPPPQQ